MPAYEPLERQTFLIMLEHGLMDFMWFQLPTAQLCSHLLHGLPHFHIIFCQLLICQPEHDGMVNDDHSASPDGLHLPSTPTPTPTPTRPNQTKGLIQPALNSVGGLDLGIVDRGAPPPAIVAVCILCFLSFY